MYRILLYNIIILSGVSATDIFQFVEEEAI